MLTSLRSCKPQVVTISCGETPQSRGRDAHRRTSKAGRALKRRHPALREPGPDHSSPKQAGSKIYRDYDPSALHTIEQIRGAQHFLRLSLQEIGPLFKSMAEEPPSDAQRLEYLEERLVVVRKQLVSLREIEEHLSGKIERLR